MIEAVHYSVWTGKGVPKTRSRLLCLITCITRVHVPQLHLSHDSVAAFALHRFRGPVVLSIIDEERETWTATYMVSIRSEPSLLVYASCARCARCATSRAMAFFVTGLWDNDVLFDTCAEHVREKDCRRTRSVRASVLGLRYKATAFHTAVGAALERLAEGVDSRAVAWRRLWCVVCRKLNL